MRTTKGNWRLAATAAVAVVVGSGMVGAEILPLGSEGLSAQSVTTNTSAGILVFPKLEIATECVGGGDAGDRCTTDNDCSGGSCDVVSDTHIQLTNTANVLTKVHCFYLNANGHCSDDESQICTQATVVEDCGVGRLCNAGWQETDFRLTLTKRQPVSWSINDPAALPLITTPGGNPPQNNEGVIPPVSEIPFTGELRCVQVDTTDEFPVARNDLKGEATIISEAAVNDGTDVAKYNAIGIPAIAGRLADAEAVDIDDDGIPDTVAATLNIGGPDAHYNSCPNILTMNHFFEGAEVNSTTDADPSTITTDVTFVPCSSNYLIQENDLAESVLQFLIYNEFEQRFSTSTRLSCYRDVQLSDIDTRPGDPGNSSSIFSIGTQGTLSGMSRIRAVSGPGDNDDDYDGNAVLAVITENWNTQGTVRRSMSNVTHTGVRSQGDRVIMPLP